MTWTQENPDMLEKSNGEKCEGERLPIVRTTSIGIKKLCCWAIFTLAYCAVHVANPYDIFLRKVRAALLSNVYKGYVRARDSQPRFLCVECFFFFFRERERESDRMMFFIWWDESLLYERSGNFINVFSTLRSVQENQTDFYNNEFFIKVWKIKKDALFYYFLITREVWKKKKHCNPKKNQKSIYVCLSILSGNKISFERTCKSKPGFWLSLIYIKYIIGIKFRSDRT